MCSGSKKREIVQKPHVSVDPQIAEQSWRKKAFLFEFALTKPKERNHRSILKKASRSKFTTRCERSALSELPLCPPCTGKKRPKIVKSQQPKKARKSTKKQRLLVVIPLKRAGALTEANPGKLPKITPKKNLPTPENRVKIHKACPKLLQQCRSCNLSVVFVHLERGWGDCVWGKKKPINIKNFGGTSPGVRPVCPGDTSHLSRDMSHLSRGHSVPFVLIYT